MTLSEGLYSLKTPQHFSRNMLNLVDPRSSTLATSQTKLRPSDHYPTPKDVSQTLFG